MLQTTKSSSLGVMMVHLARILRWLHLGNIVLYEYFSGSNVTTLERNAQKNKIKSSATHTYIKIVKNSSFGPEGTPGKTPYTREGRNWPVLV